MSKVSEAIYNSGHGDAAVPIFGIECEIEAVTRQPSLGGTWSMTEDGSLRNGGKEFISSPVPLSSAIEAFEALHAQKFYNEAEAFSERTSIHVHMNCQSLTVQQVRVLVLLYAMFEEYFFAMTTPARRGNIHCVPLTETYLPVLYGNTIQGMLQRWHKYTALNIKPLSQHGTVEFRHMHGHADKELFAEWLGVLGRLWELSSRTNQITPASLDNPRPYFDLLFGGTRVHTKDDVALFTSTYNQLLDVKLSFL